jgi:hypothetical protein
MNRQTITVIGSIEHSPSGQGTGVLGKAEANGRIVGSIAIVGHSEQKR